MRHAVLLAGGDYDRSRAATGPQPEFARIAEVLNADVLSYGSGLARRGAWFQKLFGTRRVWGAAVDMALASRRYDRIYATGEDIGVRAALLLRAFGWRGRMIMVVHNANAKRARQLNAIAGKMVDAFIVVSEEQAEIMRQGGVPSSQVRRVNYWIDTDFFSPDPSLDPATTETNFVACGAENRDYDTLRKAVQICKLKTSVYGHGFFGENVAGKGADGDANYVLMPRVPFTDLRAAYQRATAVVVPLHAGQYAAGLTGLLEAMAMGAIAIVSASPGIKEYLTQVDPRLIVPTADPEALAKVMQMVAADPAQFADIKPRNRQWVVAHSSVESNAHFISGLMKAGDLGGTGELAPARRA